jgi:anti-sigma regulatory factor (Ser/Thr protein kinase)
LARTPAAARTARHELAGWLGCSHDDPELIDAALLVSVLVTNGLVHGQGRIELRAQLDHDRLRVDVIDEGHGFARTGRWPDSGGVGGRDVGDGRDAVGAHGDVGGRGLKIVDAYASAWGISDGATDVWFELKRPRPPH